MLEKCARLLGLVAALLVGACGGTSCPAPGGTLRVTVTSSECTACTRLAILAQSPQISAAIAAGHSPCAEDLLDGPRGCVLGTIYIDTYAACGGGACGPYDVDLSTVFLPASSGSAPSITDTVSFCPFDKAGTTFTPAGNCVSSLSNQCSGTLDLIVDGTLPTGGSDGGDTGGSDGGSIGGADLATKCLPNGSACTPATALSCCTQICSCSGLCVDPPKVICN